AGLDAGFEGVTGSIHPQDHTEVEQPHANPTASSPCPSITGVQREAAGELGAEICPQGSPGVPAGRGALLRQEAIASREDSGVPPAEESPAKVLQKGDSQPEPLGPKGSWGIKKVPPRSQSLEVASAAAGKARRAVGRGTENYPGEIQTDSSSKMEICPWEESREEQWGSGRAAGKGGRKGDPHHPGEELGVEKPPAKTSELLKVASERAESVEVRRAEVCPWETREGAGTLRGEICPWDVEGNQSRQQRSPQPGEGVKQPGTGLTAEHPALPKISSQLGGTMESKKANICPWEVEDEPPGKSDICPWEEPAAPSRKERLRQDTLGTSKGESKAGSRGLGDTKAETKKSQSVESIKAE
ncbi:GP179 protein, partial [Galbula dea]|nr:GP179 protein [Galbula dea]